MKEITSRTHPDIQKVAQLEHKKYRLEYQQFVAEGIRTCSALIEGGYEPVMLYVLPTEVAAAQQLVSADYLTVITQPVLEKISQTTTSSGVVGVFALPPEPSISSLGQGVVLANITDPGNMGTLIRTCAAVGKKTVVVISGTDPFGAKAVQASAGTLSYVKIFHLSWEQLLAHKGHLRLCALVVAHGTAPRDIDWQNTLIVVGNEAHGLAPSMVDVCEEKVTLPMPGKTESLNAAVAGSIALYLSTTV